MKQIPAGQGLFLVKYFFPHPSNEISLVNNNLKKKTKLGNVYKLV